MSSPIYMIVLTGLKRHALQLSGTSGFSFCASNFSVPVAQWAREQASCLPIESLKEQTIKTYQGKQTLRATCPKGKLEFKIFSSPD